MQKDYSDGIDTCTNGDCQNLVTWINSKKFAECSADIEQYDEKLCWSCLISVNDKRVNVSDDEKYVDGEEEEEEGNEVDNLGCNVKNNQVFLDIFNIFNQKPTLFPVVLGQTYTFHFLENSY